MADAITIPEERTPSYLNRYGFTGAKIGALGVLAIATPFAIGGIALTTATAIVAGLAGGTLIGACGGVGCIRGKEAIMHNMAEGRTIYPPSRLNEGVVNGVINGSLVGLAAYTVTAAIAGAAASIALIVGGLGVGVTAAAGYMQSKQHQEKMAVEYDNAKSKAAELQQGMMGQLMEQFTGKDQGKTTAPEIDGPDIEPNKVTKEDMAEIERRSKKKGDIDGVRDWAEMIQELQEDKAESRKASLA